MSLSACYEKTPEVCDAINRICLGMTGDLSQVSSKAHPKNIFRFHAAVEYLTQNGLREDERILLLGSGRYRIEDCLVIGPNSQILFDGADDPCAEYHLDQGFVVYTQQPQDGGRKYIRNILYVLNKEELKKELMLEENVYLPHKDQYDYEQRLCPAELDKVVYRQCRYLNGNPTHFNQDCGFRQEQVAELLKEILELLGDRKDEFNLSVYRRMDRSFNDTFICWITNAVGKRVVCRKKKLFIFQQDPALHKLTGSLKDNIIPVDFQHELSLSNQSRYQEVMRVRLVDILDHKENYYGRNLPSG